MKTIGELYDPIALAETKEQAQEHVNKIIEYLSDHNPDWSPQDCRDVALRNIGYYAGYYSAKTRKRIYELYETQHPVLDMWEINMITEGGYHLDKRGYVKFINEAGGAVLQRLYIVHNHRSGQIRAWHGHKHEDKRVICIRGVALFGLVKIDDWTHPDKTIKPTTFVLSAEKPQLLYIPPGYANGWQSLTEDCEVLFVSSTPLGASQHDDFRYDFDYWDIWEVENR